MAKNKKTSAEEPIEGVENLLSKTEHYIEENQKSLTIIVTAIVIVVLGYLGYRNLYVAPLEEEARSQIYMAERYFEQDSFYLALYGDGNYPGFADIIDDYSVTKTANLAHYYAGISYLRIEEYQNA
ncbi:MAG: tetratricopeptide repeat protein, partial [Bacteroidales bacterium]